VSSIAGPASRRAAFDALAVAIGSIGASGVTLDVVMVIALALVLVLVLVGCDCSQPAKVIDSATVRQCPAPTKRASQVWLKPCDAVEVRGGLAVR